MHSLIPKQTARHGHLQKRIPKPSQIQIFLPIQIDSLKRIEIEKSPCSMIDCEIDLLERIHLPMLIGLVKPTNFANEPSSVIGSMKHSAVSIRSEIVSHLKTD